MTLIEIGPSGGWYRKILAPYMRDRGKYYGAHFSRNARSAGFKFVGSSEINANPRDPKVHPEGVWTLPPNYRLGDTNRAKYGAIGESDCMTLKFVKPSK